MNSNQKPEWQKKLEEMEAEIYNSNQIPLNPINSEKSINMFIKLKTWFISLPTLGQIVLSFFGLMIIASLLKTIFSLVQLAISLLFLGLIIYFIYQLLIKSKS